MSEVEHECFSEILTRRTRGILAHMMLRVVFPFKIPVMRRAKRIRKEGGTEQPAVRFSDGVCKLMAQHVTQ